MKVSDDPNGVLSTYALGSCIGVVAYDPHLSIAGMLHILLPDSTILPEKAKQHPYVFADTGLRLFLKELFSKGANRIRLKLAIAGGASVLSQNDFLEVGKKNIQAIENLLANQSLDISFKEIGGNNNRTLHFYSATKTLEVHLPTEIKRIQF